MTSIWIKDSRNRLSKKFISSQFRLARKGTFFIVIAILLLLLERLNFRENPL